MAALSVEEGVHYAGLMCMEHQLHLADGVAEMPWQVDLKRGVLEFIPDEGDTLSYPAHLLGTESESSETWMWAWANPSGLSESVTELARFVRQQDCAELQVAETPLEPALPLRYTLASIAMSKVWTYYAAPTGNGTRAWMLLGGSGIRLPAPSPARVTRVIGEGLASMPVADQPRAVSYYVKLREIPFSWEGRTCLLDVGGDSLQVVFDENRHLVGIHGSSPSAPAPEQQPSTPRKKRRFLGRRS